MGTGIQSIPLSTYWFDYYVVVVVGTSTLGGTWAEGGRVQFFLVVKELGFLNVRSGVALPSAETVPCNDDQHTLPKSNPTFC